jgi:hypothetical protein
VRRFKHVHSVSKILGQVSGMSKEKVLNDSLYVHKHIVFKVQPSCLLELGHVDFYLWVD